MTIKKSSIGSLALLLSLGAASQPITASLSINPVWAQSVNFSLPSSVPQGTTIQINGSPSMASVNQSLKQRFEQQYPGTKVNVANGGTSDGIQALLDGKADLAAIGRPLTAQEKSQGLIAVPVGRDKIAIVVGTKNPLSKSLDINQFAKIFRGEIKNWSEVGGKAGAIRVVDRPAVNDTRQAFRNYPAFKGAPFETGATADKLNDESTAAVIQKLGANGISYLPANQVRGQAGVKSVPMNGTAPTNSKYPFSQSLFYVYKAENPPSSAVQAFLGYTAAKAGQEAIKAAGVEAISLNPVGAKAAPLSTKPIAATNGKVNPTSNAAANAGANKAAKNSAGNKAAALNAPASGQTADPNGKTALMPSSGATSAAEEGGMPSWWWLLPLAFLAALFWMLGKERSRPSPQAYNDPAGFDDTNFPGGLNPDQSEQDVDGTRSQLNSPLDPTATSDPIVDSPNFLGQDTNLGGTAPVGGAALAAGAAIAGGAGAAAWSFLSGNQASGSQASSHQAADDQAQSDSLRLNAETETAPSNGLDDLPHVETQGQISILPRNAEWATIRWDVPRSLRADVPRQGRERLVVRLYDVTGLDLATETPDKFQQFDCDDLALSCNVPIPASDRTYLAEIGYLGADDHWARFARSTPVWVPATNRMG